jgi:membrane fusion protein, multidrug efflux system
MSKKYYSALALTAIMFACSAPATKDKKLQELDKLKKEEADLKQKIAKLEEETNVGDSTKKKKAVAITNVKDTVFEHYIDIQGNVDARENVNVSSRTAGVITSILVKEGQSVSQGQMLAQVDDQVMRANMAELHTQLDLANTMFQKQQNLWNQQIGSEVQYLNAKNQKESLEKRIATMQDQMNQARIISPISGTVDAVIAKVGDNAMPGNPAFRVVNNTNLRVLANIAEAYAGRVKTGDAVILDFPDIDKELRTKISFAAKVIDPLSRTIKIEVPLPADAAFRPNMVVRIKIIDYVAPKAVVIPVNAVQYTSGNPYIMIAQQTKDGLIAKRREIELGRTYNDKAEIKSGLQAGEQIITTGYQGLNDNDLIQL